MGTQLLACASLLAISAVLSVDIFFAITLTLICILLVGPDLNAETSLVVLTTLCLLVGTSPSILRGIAASAWASFLPKNFRLESISALLFAILGLFFLGWVDMFQSLGQLSSQIGQSPSSLMLSYVIAQWYGTLLSLGVLFFLPALVCSLAAELPFAYAKSFSRWGLGHAGLGLRLLLILAVSAFCFQFWADFSKEKIGQGNGIEQAKERAESEEAIDELP